MSKSIKLKDNNYWDSSSVIHATNGYCHQTSLNQYLPSKYSGSAMYTTQFLQLGYINCDLLEYTNWTNITLLISSTFYGVQHWSTHLLTLAQAKYIQANYLKLGGNDRNFYYKVDETNKRIYLYAKCTGGNAFGNWNTTLLNHISSGWIPEMVCNVAQEDSWVEISAVS